MKHCLILIGILFNLFFNIPSVYAENKNDLIETARYFSSAILNKDFEKVINLYEPSMVDSMGGEDIVIKKIKEALLLAEKENMVISEIEILGKSTVVRTKDTEEYAVVYTKNIINSDEEKMFIDSYMVFVTRDGFPYWFFVADGGYQTELILKELLKDKYKDLNIPKRKLYNEDKSFLMIEQDDEWVPSEKTLEMMKNLVEDAEVE